MNSVHSPRGLPGDPSRRLGWTEPNSRGRMGDGLICAISSNLNISKLRRSGSSFPRLSLFPRMVLMGLKRDPRRVPTGYRAKSFYVVRFRNFVARAASPAFVRTPAARTCYFTFLVACSFSRNGADGDALHILPQNHPSWHDGRLPCCLRATIR
jgi:hypothetical protein